MDIKGMFGKSKPKIYFEQLDDYKEKRDAFVKLYSEKKLRKIEKKREAFLDNLNKSLNIIFYRTNLRSLRKLSRRFPGHYFEIHKRLRWVINRLEFDTDRGFYIGIKLGFSFTDDAMSFQSGKDKGFFSSSVKNNKNVCSKNVKIKNDLQQQLDFLLEKKVDNTNYESMLLHNRIFMPFFTIKRAVKYIPEFYDRIYIPVHIRKSLVRKFIENKIPKVFGDWVVPVTPEIYYRRFIPMFFQRRQGLRNKPRIMIDKTISIDNNMYLKKFNDFLYKWFKAQIATTEVEKKFEPLVSFRLHYKTMEGPFPGGAFHYNKSKYTQYGQKFFDLRQNENDPYLLRKMLCFKMPVGLNVRLMNICFNRERLVPNYIYIKEYKKMLIHYLDNITKLDRKFYNNVMSKNWQIGTEGENLKEGADLYNRDIFDDLTNDEAPLKLNEKFISLAEKYVDMRTKKLIRKQEKKRKEQNRIEKQSTKPKKKPSVKSYKSKVVKLWKQVLSSAVEPDIYFFLKMRISAFFQRLGWIQATEIELQNMCYQSFIQWTTAKRSGNRDEMVKQRNIFQQLLVLLEKNEYDINQKKRLIKSYVQTIGSKDNLYMPSISMQYVVEQAKKLVQTKLDRTQTKPHESISQFSDRYFKFIKNNKVSLHSPYESNISLFGGLYNLYNRFTNIIFASDKDKQRVELERKEKELYKKLIKSLKDPELVNYVYDYINREKDDDDGNFVDTGRAKFFRKDTLQKLKERNMTENDLRVVEGYLHGAGKKTWIEAFEDYYYGSQKHYNRITQSKYYDRYTKEKKTYKDDIEDSPHLTFIEQFLKSYSLIYHEGLKNEIKNKIRYKIANTRTKDVKSFLKVFNPFYLDIKANSPYTKRQLQKIKIKTPENEDTRLYSDMAKAKIKVNLHKLDFTEKNIKKLKSKGAFGIDLKTWEKFEEYEKEMYKGFIATIVSFVKGLINIHGFIPNRYETYRKFVAKINEIQDSLEQMEKNTSKLVFKSQKTKQQKVYGSKEQRRQHYVNNYIRYQKANEDVGRLDLYNVSDGLTHKLNDMGLFPLSRKLEIGHEFFKTILDTKIDEPVYSFIFRQESDLMESVLRRIRLINLF